MKLVIIETSRSQARGSTRANIGLSRETGSVAQPYDGLPLRCSEPGVEREIAQLDHRRELTGAGPASMPPR
jgi:hypothetical protein